MPPVKKVTHTDNLIATSEYPYATFPFENFNPIQSRVYDYYDKPNNLVVAASTSSGKTIVAEIVLAHEIRKNKKKGMYLVPMRALAQEKFDDWSDPKHHFHDLNVSICTGDYKLTADRMKELEKADLIIMSSEMLSHRCRNASSEKSQFLFEIGCLVVDESHLLTVPGRGDHLEAALMKFSEMNPDSRLMLLSATMPNVQEIAEWVSYTLTKKDTVLLSSQYRPCPLYLHYEKYYDAPSNSYEANELEKIQAAIEIMEYYPNDKFLAFVHTKKTGAMLKKQLDALGITCEYHNADLDKEKRIKLEKDFKEKSDPRVVVATTTLAWGCYKFGSSIQMADGSLKNVELLSEGDEVLSLDKNFISSKVLKTEIRDRKASLKITLSSGEICEVTNDHLFYAAEGRNSPDWVEASSLKVGDFLAVPESYDFPDVKSSDKGYVIGYALGDGCLVDAGSHDDSQKLLLDIASDFKDGSHLDYIRRIIGHLCNYDLPNISQSLDGVLHLQCKARGVVSLFKPYINVGSKGDSWTLNDDLCNDREVLKGVLQGLFDSDGGYVDHGNGNFSVEFSSISKKAVLQIQQLLKTFGVFSLVGKKKMIDRVINGRKVPAKREWIWSLRIYNEQALNFAHRIGFRMIRKQKSLQESSLNQLSSHNTSSLIPVRSLIEDHARANLTTPYKMCHELGLDFWSILNKKELTSFSVEKVLKSFPKKSALNDLFEKKIKWIKIKKVEAAKGGKFLEVAVDNENYVGDGFVSHNCNLPARRVVVLGVHRGLSEVASYDIFQEVGRAGRPQFDPVGDAYILLPDTRFDDFKAKLQKPDNIISQMLEDVGGHYKTLAFHLVSEINNGSVQDRSDVHHWYKRSLACFQSYDLHGDIVEKTLESLKKCGAVWEEEDGKLTTTAVGKIASLFYYSPYDVADLKKGFKYLFENNLESSDVLTSIVLGNLDTHRMNIVSRAERDAFLHYKRKLEEHLPPEYFLNDASIKSGYAYYMLLNGLRNEVYGGFMRGLQFDFPRMGQVLFALNGFSKWGKQDYLKTLQTRIVYGIKPELVPLVQLPDVGKVRAEKLWKAGLRTLQDVAASPERVGKILKFKEAKVQEITAKARGLLLIGE